MAPPSPMVEFRVNVVVPLMVKLPPSLSIAPPSPAAAVVLLDWKTSLFMTSVPAPAIPPPPATAVLFSMVAFLTVRVVFAGV